VRVEPKSSGITNVKQSSYAMSSMPFAVTN